MESGSTLPDSTSMSIRTDTGIHIPNEKLNRANKSTLVSIINQLTNKLSSVESELSDARDDTDRLSRKVAKTKAELSDVREDTDRVSKELADTNARVSDLEENTDTDSSDTTESDNSTDNPNGEDTQSTV